MTTFIPETTEQTSTVDRLTCTAECAGLFIPVVLTPIARLCADSNLFDVLLAANHAGRDNGGEAAATFTANGVAYSLLLDTEHRQPVLYIDLAETSD